MTLNPKVSIIIPVYNGSNFLKEAIDSALRQTHNNIEVIVINDGSNDNGETEKIAKEYGDRIRYFSKSNGGVSSALNLGIRQMEGEYFSWLSHDDVYCPNKIEEQINYLNKISNKNVVLYSDFEIIDKESNHLDDVILKNINPADFRFFITIKNEIHGCSLLVPRECFFKIGLFNEEFKTVQDYDLWFRFAEKYDFVHIPKILVKSRFHKKQGSIKLKNVVNIEMYQYGLNCINQLTNDEIINKFENKLSVYNYYFRLFYNLFINKKVKLSIYTIKLSFYNLKKEKKRFFILLFFYDIFLIPFGLFLFFYSNSKRKLIRIKKRIFNHRK